MCCQRDGKAATTQVASADTDICCKKSALPKKKKKKSLAPSAAERTCFTFTVGSIYIIKSNFYGDI